MANNRQNKINFNRKYISNNVGYLAGPKTYIVDTSQMPPIDNTKSTESSGNS